MITDNNCCCFTNIAASVDTDGDRTLAIALGTVGGLLIILFIVVGAFYAAHHCSWLADRRRAKILGGEIAFDGYNGTNVRLSTLRILPRRGLLRTKLFRPKSERIQLPSAPEQSVVDLTELDEIHDQPVMVKS